MASRYLFAVWLVDIIYDVYPPLASLAGKTARIKTSLLHHYVIPGNYVCTLQVSCKSVCYRDVWKQTYTHFRIHNISEMKWIYMAQVWLTELNIYCITHYLTEWLVYWLWERSEIPDSCLRIGRENGCFNSAICMFSWIPTSVCAYIWQTVQCRKPQCFYILM